MLNAWLYNKNVRGNVHKRLLVVAYRIRELILESSVQSVHTREVTTDSGHKTRRQNFPVSSTCRFPYKLHEASVWYVTTSSVLRSNWEAAEVNLVEIGISQQHILNEATVADAASLANAGDAAKVHWTEHFGARFTAAKVFLGRRHFFAIVTQTPAAQP